MVFGWKLRQCLRVLVVMVVMVRRMRSFSMGMVEMMRCVGGLKGKPVVVVWGLTVRPVREVIDSGAMMVMRRRMIMLIRSVFGLRKE